MQYAVYLGGDVTIVSLEGYGTDAYVHLKVGATGGWHDVLARIKQQKRRTWQVAAEDAEEVLPHFNAEIVKHYELKTRHDDWQMGAA